MKYPKNSCKTKYNKDEFDDHSKAKVVCDLKINFYIRQGLELRF